MCRIQVNDYNSKNLGVMAHGGIFSSEVGVAGGDIVMRHDTLPLQVSDTDAVGGSQQPVRLAEGYLAFNGEIFSYDRDKYSSDTDYLTQLFYDCEHRGEVIEVINKNAPKWDGFWALVIYTAKDGAFTCYTDFLGKKPLYYNTEELAIASEIKGCLSKPRSLDMKFMGDVRKFGYNNDDRTAWAHVRRMVPGKVYMFSSSGPDPVVINGPEAIWPVMWGDQYNVCRQLITEAIERRVTFNKDNKIAALLSGGLDSSIICAYLAKEKFNVDYYTIENAEDEEYVQAFERMYDVKVTRLKYDIQNVLDDPNLFLEIYRNTNESPIDLGSVVPQYYLMKAIGDLGDYRICLTGDGADELFGGYSRIHEYDSQFSDVFSELPYYHLPRLDKASMRFTLELRNPFLAHDVVRFALGLSRKDRTDKAILKEAFKDWLPEEILNRKKLALKNEQIREDKIAYRNKVLDLFIELQGE